MAAYAPLLRFIRQAVTISGLGTLASASMSSLSAAYNLTGNFDSGAGITQPPPCDLLIEFEATAGAATSGGQQAVLYAQVSTDGSDFTSGNDAYDLYPIAALPLPDTNLRCKVYSLVGQLGFMPAAVKFKVLNDCGTAFSVCAIYTTEVSNQFQ